MIRHLVIMKFAADCAPEQHDRMLNMLAGLEREVPGVRAMTVGVHALSDSPLADIGLVVDLDDREALAAYTTHPYHLSVGQYFGPIKESASIVDLELP